MAFSQETETIETILQSLGLEHLISSFQEADINIQLLMESTDKEVKEVLTDIHITPGNRLRIMKQINRLKAGGQPFHQKATLTDHVESKGHSFGIEHLYIRSDRENQTKIKDEFGSPQSVVANIDCSAACNPAEVRLALIGKTGTGKSATGNTILQHNAFESFLTSISVTKFCVQNSVVRFGKKIVCVDTPGLFDTEVSNETTQKEIMKCIGITSPGPHAFIIVLTIGRFTKEEKDTVDYFVKHFGEVVYQYLIVLFTRKDDLDEHNISFKDHLATVAEPLRLFVEKCGGRAIAFNNKLKGSQSEQQVKELLKMVERNVSRNGGKFYTNEMYLQAEIEVQKMALMLIKKHQDEKDMKLKAWEESKEKSIEEKKAIISEFKEKENRVRDDVRKDIAEKGFTRAWQYLKSWWPF